MEKKNNKYTALLNVMKRELRRLVSRPLYLFCMVIAPLFCYIFFTTLMDSGLPTETAAKLYHADQTEESETVKLLFRALRMISFEGWDVAGLIPVMLELGKAGRI